MIMAYSPPASRLNRRDRLSLDQGRGTGPQKFPRHGWWRIINISYSAISWKP